MGSWRFHLDCPEPVWLVAALSLAIVGVALWLTWRDTAGTGKVLRRAVRALALLGAVFVLGLVLNPRIVHRKPDPRKPRLVMLFDASGSMAFKDAYRGEQAEQVIELLGKPTAGGDTEVSRSDVLRALLKERPKGWLVELREAFDISAWVFAGEAKGLSLDDAGKTYGVDPEGRVTALGDALETTARAAAGERPRAVVVFSDGAWNTGKSPAAVARALGRLGTPVFTVGFGDVTPPRDAAVVELKAPKKAHVGDEVFVTARVAATGMGATRLTVGLYADGALIGEKPVAAPASGRPVEVRFSHVPTEAGRIVFEARTPAQEGERDEANNTADAAVEVTDRKIRVLLIESEPRWEFRFLRSVLDRDPAVTPTVCLLRPGVGPIRGPGYLVKPPTERKDLKDYDLVILGDVPGRLLPEGFAKALSGFVRHRGGALLLIAGRRGGFRDLIGGPLDKILPVRLSGGMGGLRGGAPFRVELTQWGGESLVTRLAADPKENEHAWEQLTPVRWSAPVGGLRRGALALLVHPFRLAGAGKLPILATQRVGAGKVMYLGTEETWRWRRSVGDLRHYRFWAQAVRWLVKKRFIEKGRRVSLGVDRAECAVGERVAVEAYCLGPDGFPLEKGEVWVEVDDGKAKRRVALEPAKGGWGLYRGSVTPSRPGETKLRPVVSVYGLKPLDVTVKITVTKPDLEPGFLAQDRAALESVAKDSGGQYISWGEGRRLPDLLGKRAERRILTSEYAPCRSGGWYLFMALTLSAAWLARKRSGLA